MENRKANSDNAAAAIEAALEAFEYEKIRKQREKVEAETRKRRMAEMRELGMSEDEIVDQLCSNRVPGPCEIMGEFPPQESCAPNPPPPGCPCPDPDCPKRSPFDYQMHDTDLAKIKSMTMRVPECALRKGVKYYLTRIHIVRVSNII